MEKEYYTIEQIMQQVWKIEGVKIRLRNKENNVYVYEKYDYERMPDEACADDLVNKVLNHLYRTGVRVQSSIFMINLKGE
jgi:hypothetical protein